MFSTLYFFLCSCSTILASRLKGYRKNVNPERNILARRLFRMHVAEGKGGGNGTEKGDSDRVVPGNFTEWRNNVSYATFPEWRAAGGWWVACKYSPRERGRRRERDREGENSREKGGKGRKREEMQSLSGMQLGARHRPGKDPSLFRNVPARILLFRSLRHSASLSFLLPPPLRSIIYTYTDFLPRTLSRNPRQRLSTHAHTARITTIENIREL